MNPARRSFLEAAGAAALSSSLGSEARAEDDLPAPKYVLAMNLEIMFPRAMPYETRIVEAAACGARHYGFWGHANKNLVAMLDAQEKHDMTCVSISGNPRTGWSSGLTKPGAEQEFLDDFEECCLVAKKFGAKNLITFVGAVRRDVPVPEQEERIIAGLEKAGPIAEKHDVYLTLEPLNRVESPQMTMVTAADAYKYAEGARHPRIKVDFDVYHRALGEGNVLNTLADGLKRDLVRFVEVGDVPGRKEPGTGETNYVNIFRLLRRTGFAGAIGMEHGSSKTPRHAWEVVKSLAGL